MKPNPDIEAVEAVPVEGNVSLQTAIDEQLAKYDQTDATLALLAEECNAIEIKDADDKEGYDKCRALRRGVREAKGALEAQRVEFKSKALAFGRGVDGRAGEIRAKLQEAEDILKAKEAVVDKERERLKQAKALEKQKILTERMKKLDAVNAGIARAIVEVMNARAFAVALETATLDYTEAKERAKEEAKVKKAADAKKRREEAAKAKKLADEQEELRAGQEKLRKDREALEARAVTEPTPEPEPTAEPKPEPPVRKAPPVAMKETPIPTTAAGKADAKLLRDLALQLSKIDLTVFKATGTGLEVDRILDTCVDSLRVLADELS